MQSYASQLSLADLGRMDDFDDDDEKSEFEDDSNESDGLSSAAVTIDVDKKPSLVELTKTKRYLSILGCFFAKTSVHICLEWSGMRTRKRNRSLL